MQAKLNNIVWILGCLCFALAGAWLAYTGLANSGVLGGWSRVQGRVVSHFPLKKNVYEAKVGHTFDGGLTYQYEVDGKVLRHTLSMIQVTQDKIQDFYADHPVGRAVEVQFQTGCPQESRLAAACPGRLPFWAKIALGVVFCLLGLGMAGNFAAKAFKRGG